MGIHIIISSGVMNWILDNIVTGGGDSALSYIASELYVRGEYTLFLFLACSSSFRLSNRYLHENDSLKSRQKLDASASN